MKRLITCLLCFSILLNSAAQTRLPLSIPAGADSIHIAQLQLTEGIKWGEKDTALALAMLRNASRIFKKNNLALEEGKCHKAIADIYFDAGQYNRAFANYLSAQDEFYEVSQNDFFYATLGVAKSQYHRGLYRFAIKSFAEVIEFAFKHKDEKLKSAAAEYLGDIYFILQSNPESRNYFTNAFIANQQLNDDKSCLRIAGKLFTLHYQQRQFDSALWYSNFSMRLSDKLHEKSILQVSSVNRIAALIRLKRLSEAGEALNGFDREQLSQWDLNMRVRFEAMTASYYLASKEPTRAIMLYDTAIKHASAINTPDLQAIVYNIMADSYAEQNDYEKAYRYNLKYAEMMNNFYSNAVSHLSKIESLIKEDVYDSKIRYLSSLNRIRELQFLRDQDAKQNLQTENRLKDSLFGKEKQLSIALELENIYKSKQLETQQQISAVLNKQSQSQKKQLQREHILRFTLVGGLICLFFIGALAWYQYGRTKAKNRIIEKQAGELQILMKEIHHRVKNNLQIISSLLDIQSLTLDNDSALQAIRGSKNRVQSMAIIHRYLYHENNLRGIMVEDYMKNLSENLFSSYNINPDKIKLETDIDRLNLDIDTMIPLGLIINELISNSLKYAFNSTGKAGRIFISLKEKENNLHLVVRDNGHGFPAAADMQKKNTFGLQLISAFAQKLKASLELYNDNGAVVSMSIKKYKLA